MYGEERCVSGRRAWMTACRALCEHMRTYFESSTRVCCARCRPTRLLSEEEWCLPLLPCEERDEAVCGSPLLEPVSTRSEPVGAPLSPRVDVSIAYDGALLAEPLAPNPAAPVPAAC